MRLSKRIRNTLQEMGLTQEQFGELIGKAGSTVRSWELGASMPTCKTLIDITRKTGKTSDYLLGLTHESEEAET